MIFGQAPADAHVTVSSPLGTRNTVVNAQQDFRWTYDLSHNQPDLPLAVTVSCDGCGKLPLRVDSLDTSAGGPNSNFSSFFADHESDWNPGAFAFGGFDNTKHTTEVTLASRYGSARFSVRDSIWGGRMTFPNAPIGKSFTVTVGDGSASASYVVTRHR